VWYEIAILLSYSNGWGAGTDGRGRLNVDREPETANRERVIETLGTQTFAQRTRTSFLRAQTSNRERETSFRSGKTSNRRRQTSFPLGKTSFRLHETVVRCTEIMFRTAPPRLSAT